MSYMSNGAGLHGRLSLAIAGGFTLWAGCGGPEGASSAGPKIDPPPPVEHPSGAPPQPAPDRATASPLATAEPTALGSAAPTVTAPPAPKTTCPPNTKRETQCLAKNTGPASQVPNPVHEFDAQGCVSASAMRSVCNGVHDVLSGPRLANGKCCFEVCTGLVAPCGRPLAVAGDAGTEARLAPAAQRDDWAPLSEPPREPDAELARAWLGDALQEHASIASFARFALELLSVGAPAELVEAAQQAGLEEIEHARLCFALASAYRGAPLGPGPLSLAGVELRSGLAAIAAAAAEEACCGETFAALCAARAREACADARASAALERIAADEARHAELGWRFVAWASARGDDQVRAEVARGFQRGLAALDHTRSGAEGGAVDLQLRAAGRLSGGDLAACAGDSIRLIGTLRRELEERAIRRPAAFDAAIARAS